MMEGEIQVIYGPMFSGKSTELLRRIRRYTAGRKSCIILKDARDNRYDATNLCTHDMVAGDAHPVKALDEVTQALVDSYEVIGIDEAQFFDNVAEFCESNANAGKIVIVAALDGTFQRHAFGKILSLVPLAESVTKLSAICVGCGRNAAFSKRIGSETEIHIIGGSEKYIATCRKCHSL